jgi:hypothetical protein
MIASITWNAGGADWMTDCEQPEVQPCRQNQEDCECGWLPAASLLRHWPLLRPTGLGLLSSVRPVLLDTVSPGRLLLTLQSGGAESLCSRANAVAG